jgi:hypothetical protein
MHYQPRTVDAQLAGLMDAMGAVVIEGPKACGKTMTALQLARSVVRLDVDANARARQPSIRRSCSRVRPPTDRRVADRNDDLDHVRRFVLPLCRPMMTHGTPVQAGGPRDGRPRCRDVAREVAIELAQEALLRQTASMQPMFSRMTDACAAPCTSCLGTEQ